MFDKSLMLFHSLLDLLLPRACLLCHRQTALNHHLCVACCNEMPILSHSCKKCAQFLHNSERSHLICGQCLRDPPPYDQVYALFQYKPPLPGLIAAFKFEDQFSHGRLFSSLMERQIPAWYRNSVLPDILIPMPLHPLRLRERGFNQAMELAKPLAAALKIPLDHEVRREKATRAQHRLKRHEREANLVNAFRSSRLYTGLHVAIIDDVMTTGQTAASLARLLKSLGAVRVDIWCCGRCNIE